MRQWAIFLITILLGISLCGCQTNYGEVTQNKAMEHIREKYEDDTFEFSANQGEAFGTNNSGSYILELTHPSFPNDIITLTVVPNEAGGKQYYDNYIMIYNRDSINSYIEELMAKAGLEGKAFINIDPQLVFGDDVTTKTDLKNFLHNSKLVLSINYFINTGSDITETQAAEIEKIFEDDGLVVQTLNICTISGDLSSVTQSNFKQLIESSDSVKTMTRSKDGQTVQWS